MSVQWVEFNNGDIRLALGDCLDILPTLEAVDCVLVDIPYGVVNRESGGLRKLDKAEADVVTFGLDDVVAHCVRLAATSYVFCGTEQVSELRRGFVLAGLTTRLCIWEKTNPSPMNGESLWLSSSECCVFARKPKAYFSEHCQSSVWRGPIERDQIHPTQKPQWLFERLVRASCPKYGTVLDFCLGSGTTAVSCVRLDRKCIGVEKHAPYFDIAVKRIEAELNRAPLFEEPPQVQKNIFY